jgi:uncharacterized protein YjbI with pentapeptide repeats
MRATEVLTQYANGRRDFSGENLRGQSFQGTNLSGANFSEADIRGANFTNAKLIGANFSGTRAGLQHRWLIFLYAASFFLTSLSGAAARLAGGIATNPIAIASNHTVFSIVTMIVLAVLAILFIFIALRGVTADLAAVLGAIAGALIVFGAVAFIADSAGYSSAGDIGLSLVMRVAWTLAGTLPWALAGALIIGLAETLLWTLARTLTQFLAGVLAMVGFWVLPWDKTKVFFKPVDSVVTEAALGAVALAVVLFGSYMSWYILLGNKKFALMRQIAIAFAATRGTNFHHADLTDADFTSATLKSTDFRNATLTRTNLHQTKKLDRARVGNTILIDTKVRDLVVTHRGAKQSYIECNLKGANLVGADLNDADLTEADISGATLQGAWLERANLTKTQALNTNFNQAHLTGACLEAWNIGSTTQLDGVICDYVYLLNNHQERRPNSGEFAPGEFTKLFQEVLNTVDLIFRNGIDWKAFVLSFNAVQAQNEGTELSLQSIENKGDGVVVARLNVSEDADKEKIHSDFMQSYELALKAVEETYKAKLNAKDEQIEIYRQKSSEMKEIVSLLASRPINVDVKATADSKSMNDSTDQSRNIKIGDINATGSSISLGDMSGIVTTTINQLPPSPEPEKPGIKELLLQLQAAINDPNLADDDKTQVLEQIKALAEAGQNPNKETAQKQAKRAMGFLKVIAEGLPSAAQLVKTCQDVLPAIAHFFGL